MEFQLLPQLAPAPPYQAVAGPPLLKPTRPTRLVRRPEDLRLLHLHPTRLRRHLVLLKQLLLQLIEHRPHQARPHRHLSVLQIPRRVRPERGLRRRGPSNRFLSLPIVPARYLEY